MARPVARPRGDTAAYGPARELGLGTPGVRCWCPATGWPTPLARAAGVWAHEALRIAACARGTGSRPTTARSRTSSGCRPAVHLNKGCYRGQETVARVHNLGRPPRRMVFLHLDGSGHTLPERGAPSSSATVRSVS